MVDAIAVTCGEAEVCCGLRRNGRLGCYTFDNGVIDIGGLTDVEEVSASELLAFARTKAGKYFEFVPVSYLPAPGKGTVVGNKPAELKLPTNVVAMAGGCVLTKDHRVECIERREGETWSPLVSQLADVATIGGNKLEKLCVGHTTGSVTCLVRAQTQEGKFAPQTVKLF